MFPLEYAGHMVELLIIKEEKKMKTIKELAKELKVSGGSIYQAYVLQKVKGEVIEGKIYICPESFAEYKRKAKRGRKKNHGVDARELFRKIKPLMKEKGMNLYEFFYLAKMERMRYYGILKGQPARQDEIEKVEKVIADLEAK